MKGSLFGKTILVTRPRRQADALIRGLRRHGANVIAAPVIRIVSPASWAPMDASLRRLSKYDTLIFTSVNGVSQFFKRAQKILRRKPRRPRRLYAIGPATSKVLRQYGWSAVGVPDGFEGEALARHIAGRMQNLRGWNILLPRAKVARDILPRILRKKGARVDVVEAYRTIADPEGRRIIRRAAKKGGIDAVTFTSSSTAEHFVSALRPLRPGAFFRNVKALSIGPVTSATLRRHGVGKIVQAKIFTTEGLIQSAIDALRKT